MEVEGIPLRSISLEDLEGMEKAARVNFVNALPGFKSATLIGSINKDGNPNVAVFNTVIHVGTDPALMGMLVRPVSVPRHTYQNIKATKYFTVNHINEDIHKSAHQTSARYPETTSEFAACGLTPVYTKVHPAPYVGQSRIRIGLEYVEEHTIEANKTVFVVGRILEVIFPKEALRHDGSIDIEIAGTIAISGLDGYHRTSLIDRLTYAKADKPLRSL